MKRRDRWLWLLAGGWLTLLAPNGCVLDRLGTADSNSGGSGGDGGSGGSSACFNSSECPPPSADCRLPFCEPGGSCTEVYDFEGEPCAEDGICNHIGDCTDGLGAVCSSGEDCFSGRCVDGVCCDTLCDDLCQGCDVEGLEGTCSLQPSGADPSQECALHCDGLGACLSGGHVWSRTYGSIWNDFPRAVEVDSAGNIVFALDYLGAITFGGGTLTPVSSYDVAVAKLDSVGGHLWSLTVGGWGAQYVGGLALTSDDEVVIAGHFYDEITIGGDYHDAPCCSSDLWVAKLDADGNLLWSESFGGTGNAELIALAVDAAGDIYLGGSYDGQLVLNGTSLTNGSDDNGFVVKLFANGNYAWGTDIGDGQDQVVTSLVVDAAGDVLVAGAFAGGIPVWPSLPLATGVDVFLSKLSGENGNVSWSRSYGGVGTQMPATLALKASGSVVMAGWFDGELALGSSLLPNAGGADIFVGELDEEGAEVWSRSFGAAGNESPVDVAVDAAGNLVMVGAMDSGVNFGGGAFVVPNPVDAFVVKLGPQGEHYWSHVHGDWYNDVATSVTNHPDGGVVAVGYFENNIELASGAVSTAGDADVFVVRLTQ